MKLSGGCQEVNISKSIAINVTRCFVQNGAKVEVQSIYVHTTKCSGLFCDKQRSLEISRGTRACGCYSMIIKVSSITILHRIAVTVDGMHLCYMDDFSSLNFSRLYMKSPFSCNVRANMLDYTDAYFKLEKCIQAIIEFINLNGGFTVIGWYKRGEINDVSNEDSQNEVESSEVGHHIVQIQTTVRAVIDLEEFKNLQFEMP